MLEEESHTQKNKSSGHEPEAEDDSSTLELISRNETILVTIILINFLLQQKNTTPVVLNSLGKVKDEIQRDINFKKRQ